MTTASCGHTVDNSADLYHVIYAGDDCDPITGYHYCDVSAVYCAACTEELRVAPEFISAEKVWDGTAYE